MTSKDILIVFGTRPEAIKMAPLVREFKKYPTIFNTIVCVTGQHREMLDQVLTLFEIIPDYDLDLMKSDQDLYDLSANVLLGMRKVLNDCNPDLVLVHGDTTTSAMAALAATYQRIPVGHVEAGLRTNDIYSPWPEEINRQVTGRLATYHFTPTQISKENLKKENVGEESILLTGNTVIDALISMTTIIQGDNQLQNSIMKDLKGDGYSNAERIMNGDFGREIILVTGHRRENFGSGFINICMALKEIAQKNLNADIVYPVHLNPNVQLPVHELLDGLNNVYLIPPQNYLPFVFLMIHSKIILTDSGGVQEEAPSLGKPVLVMRKTTERPEAVIAGTVRLVGTEKQAIVNDVTLLLNNSKEYAAMASAYNPYGDGTACKKIVNYCKNIYN
jgi:UDP-N-acetylglucosamine 2-epimerase (non-hydrolysing)